MRFYKVLFVINVFISFHVLIGAENKSSVSPKIAHLLRIQYINLFDKYIQDVFDIDSEIIFKNDPIIKYILPGLRCYSQIDPYGNSLLHYAVNQPQKQSSHLIRFLLEYEQSLYIKNKAGVTPVHIACIAGRQDSLEILSLWEEKNKQR